MRQQDKTPEDDKLRTALENMRYGACTPEDPDFLRTRVAGFRPEDPKLFSSDFRNVSIITARNSQKDMLNQLGAQRFAADNKQTLVDFCSVDRVSSRSVDRAKWKNCEQSEIKKMTKGLQKKLWKAAPCTTNEFIPGTLSLCIGMPVMLRANDATEMCITKGQEGAVVGWDESVGPMGQKILHTLFVELINPPHTVQIEGLPKNVVPLVRTVSHVTILLEDNTLLSVLREQIVALVNFGMTDYTSQGKSRPHNAVDLGNCKTHMSYYVALSRGTSAKGTIIVQDLNESRVTSGISGYLRQEMRELEVLDEITRLKCEGLLPPSVTGLYRCRLLRSFYAWKANHRDSAHFHPAIRWDSSMGPRIPDAVVYSEWRPSIPISRKRKNVAVDDVDPVHDRPAAKKPTKIAPVPEPGPDPQNNCATTSVAVPTSVTTAMAPVGLVWDSRDHSCAYDATFTILTNIWAENHVEWSGRFMGLSPIMGMYSSALQTVLEGRATLETARDDIRVRLPIANPVHFPIGPHPTSIDRLVAALSPSKTYAKGRQSCVSCGYNDPIDHGLLETTMSAGLSNRVEYPRPVGTQEWITMYLSKGLHLCPTCRLHGTRRRMTMLSRVLDVPPLIVLEINHKRLHFDEELVFDCNGALVKLKLRGIIYGGQGHFTCRFVDRGGVLWFHDGIATARRC
ncbi:hypothetical protein B0H17DRAFT_866647, partial [Mycena rosella]